MRANDLAPFALARALQYLGAKELSS